MALDRPGRVRVGLIIHQHPRAALDKAAVDHALQKLRAVLGLPAIGERPFTVQLSGGQHAHAQRRGEQPHEQARMHGGQLVFADDALFQQRRALAVDLRREVARCPQRVKIEHAHHAVKRGADLRAGHLLLLHEARQAHQRRVRQGLVLLRGALFIAQYGADRRFSHGGSDPRFEIHQAGQRLVLRRGGQLGQQAQHHVLRAPGQFARRAADMGEHAPRGIPQPNGLLPDGQARPGLDQRGRDHVKTGVHL